MLEEEREAREKAHKEDCGQDCVCGKTRTYYRKYDEWHKVVCKQILKININWNELYFIPSIRQHRFMQKNKGTITSKEILIILSNA